MAVQYQQLKNRVAMGVMATLVLGVVCISISDHALAQNIEYTANVPVRVTNAHPELQSVSVRCDFYVSRPGRPGRRAGRGESAAIPIVNGEVDRIDPPVSFPVNVDTRLSPNATSYNVACELFGIARNAAGRNLKSPITQDGPSSSSYWTSRASFPTVTSENVDFFASKFDNEIVDVIINNQGSGVQDVIIGAPPE